MFEVQRVLAEIGAQNVPQILVFNKVDKLEPDQQPRQRIDSYALDGHDLPRVFVSAATGAGVSALRTMIADAAQGRLNAADHPQDSDAIIAPVDTSPPLPIAAS
jgi:GTP-binding protein HflX